MLAIVLSSTTMSCATEMSTRAQPRRTCPPIGGVTSSVATWVVSAIGFLDVGGVHRGGHDDLVDDAGDQVLVGDLPEHEDPVQADAGQGRTEQAHVEVLTDLSARFRLGIDRLRDGDLRSDDLLPERRRELG